MLPIIKYKFSFLNSVQSSPFLDRSTKYLTSVCLWQCSTEKLCLKWERWVSWAQLLRVSLVKLACPLIILHVCVQSNPTQEFTLMDFNWNLITITIIDKSLHYISLSNKSLLQMSWQFYLQCDRIFVTDAAIKHFLWLLCADYSYQRKSCPILLFKCLSNWKHVLRFC